MARHARHFEREIEKLKKMILTLGTAAEESIKRSVKSLTERDSALGFKVIEHDTEIDNMEVDIEEECLKILALHQPVANDLRLIVSILKINSDLERVADLAVNIAERAIFLTTQGKLELPGIFHDMVKKAQWMLKQCLDSLVNADVVLARKICAADDEVDDINRELYSYLGKQMQDYPAQLPCYIHLLSTCRYLERVADHATNIAEDVIYMVEGEIVRHRKEMLNKENDRKIH